jgi:SSS family solute:Na+ symporter
VEGALRPLDLAVVGAFLAATVWLGARRGGGAGDADDFLVAGRTLTLPAFVATLVSTWYGGILGVGEYSYLHGLSNWLVLGAPYYVAALLFAWLFAGRAREEGQYTVPDRLYRTYGTSSGVVGAIMVLVLTLPASYLLMLGVILRRATGLSQPSGIVLAAGLCVAYVVLRGFRSVVGPKILQFVLMYGGFLLLVPIAAFELGGPAELRAALPKESFEPLGGRSLGFVFAWYFIALQTLVEPTFFQRCDAARSPAVARRGLVVSVAFFALFDGLTTLTGMYARALLPDLPSAVDAFPALAEALLPAGLLGLFYAAMLATVFSTVDSFLFVGGVTVGRDLVWRLSSGRRDQVAWTRAGVGLAAGAATGIALASDSVVALWYGFGSVGTAVLLGPLLGSFFPRLRPPPRFATAEMIASGSVTLVWLAAAGEGPFLGVEPVYAGLATAALVQTIGIVVRRGGAPVA